MNEGASKGGKSSVGLRAGGPLVNLLCLGKLLANNLLKARRTRDGQPSNSTLSIIFLHLYFMYEEQGIERI